MNLNNRRLLRFAEYGAVSASVCGVVVAIVTRQLLYAATPLSLAVVLSLVNRHRWEWQIEQHLAQTVAQVNEQLDNLNQDTARRSDFETLSTDLAHLQTKLQAIEALAIQDNFDRRPSFETLRAELDQAIAMAHTFTREAIEALNLQERLQELESRLSQQQDDRLNLLKTSHNQASRSAPAQLG
ncbi:MAG: hypothetical protein HC805_07455 [Alkalinema sp. RL_2_19]|nr:hypothetical protein [Alkalinema sp. RL_2_19]